MKIIVVFTKHMHTLHQTNYLFLGDTPSRFLTCQMNLVTILFLLASFTQFTVLSPHFPFFNYSAEQHTFFCLQAFITFCLQAFITLRSISLSKQVKSHPKSVDGENLKTPVLTKTSTT